MNAKCDYPHCKCIAKHVFQLVVTNEKEKNVDVIKAEMFFCDYHYYVVAGNHFTCKKVGDFKFEIEGPFEQVSLIEQCMAARLVTERIRKEKELAEAKNLKKPKNT